MESTKEQKLVAGQMLTDGFYETVMSIKGFLDNPEICNKIIEGDIKSDPNNVSVEISDDGYYLIENHKHNRQHNNGNVSEIAKSIKRMGQVNPIIIDFDPITGLFANANGNNRAKGCRGLRREISAILKVKRLNPEQISLLNKQRSQKVVDTIQKYYLQGRQPYKRVYEFYLKAKGMKIKCDVMDIYALVTGNMIVGGAANKLEEKLIMNENDKVIVSNFKGIKPALKFVNEIIKSNSIIDGRREGYKWAFYPLYSLGYKFRKDKNIKFDVEKLILLLANPAIKKNYANEEIMVNVQKKKELVQVPYKMSKMWESDDRSKNFHVDGIIKLYQENVENVELCSPETYEFIMKNVTK